MVQIQLNFFIPLVPAAESATYQNSLDAAATSVNKISDSRGAHAWVAKVVIVIDCEKRVGDQIIRHSNLSELTHMENEDTQVHDTWMA